MTFISREQRKKGQILRGTETILGNREYKKTKFEGTETILGNREYKKTKFEGTETILGNREYKKTKFEGREEQAKEHGKGTPLRGLRISLRRQNTTKVMAYNITRNLPL